MSSTQRQTTAQLAAALRVSVGLLRRRLRQAREPDELSMPETSALARIDRGGPMTSAELARLEQISPQSMGATVAQLGDKGLIERTADPSDGRRAVIALTPAGTEAVRNRRARADETLAAALEGFTVEERALLAQAAPLIERLAQTI
jgi:DNA-binding MarR family transcriptional regulator